MKTYPQHRVVELVLRRVRHFGGGGVVCSFGEAEVIGSELCPFYHSNHGDSGGFVV